MPALLINAHRRGDFSVPAPSLAPLALHRQLPGYAPTPLRSLPSLARRLGVATVDLKDESARLGLPAYKVLGAGWAAYRAIIARLGRAAESWATIDELRRRLTTLPALRLVTATDGNHGRGVARVARWLGIPAEIYVPVGTAAARISAIESEGAIVVEVDGTYDETVARAAALEGDDVLLIQDHGWPGYEEIPNWVAEGYETIFAEIEDELALRRQSAYDLVLVQIGVGTLASAVVGHYRREGLVLRPALVGVEPVGAACALRSVQAGSPVMLSVGADASIMAGLNCGTPSSAAWPSLLYGIDAYVAVEDEQARTAMRWLAAEGIASGESGAAGLAGLLELLEGSGAARARAALKLDASSRVLLLSTEGVTDPVAYAAIVRRTPSP
ncbi:MAG: diaminopropionate ammonia-lyase [Gemmatimonadota bacterium]